MFIIIGKVLFKLYYNEIICLLVYFYIRRSLILDDFGDVLKLIELLVLIFLFKEEKGRFFKGFEFFSVKFLFFILRV